MNDNRSIDTCIFDLDGTIIDSDKLLVDAWKYGLEQLGKEIEEQEIIRYLGMSSTDIAKHLLKKDTAKIRELTKHRDKFFYSNWRNSIQLMSGALEVLTYLKEEKYKCAMASSNPKSRIEMILSEFGIQKYFNVIVGRDDVEYGKPHPDLINVTIKRLSAVHEKSIYVGDSIYDIMSGRAAGTVTGLLIIRPTDIVNLEPRPDYFLNNLIDLKKII